MHTWRWTRMCRAARRGRRDPQAGIGLAADAGGRRPAGPVRLGGRHAFQFRHEHSEGRSFSNRRGLVLDTFTFADPIRTLDLNPTEIDRLRVTAERVISGRKDVRELLKNRPKPQPRAARRASRPPSRSIRRRVRGDADRDRGRGPARPAVRSGVRDLVSGAISRWC